MKKDIFLEHSIFSTTISDKKIDIDVILHEFHNNTKNHTHTHFINNRWENIYINPQRIPSVLPLLSKIISEAIKEYRSRLKPHQTLVIPMNCWVMKKMNFGLIQHFQVNPQEFTITTEKLLYQGSIIYRYQKKVVILYLYMRTRRS